MLLSANTKAAFLTINLYLQTIRPVHYLWVVKVVIGRRTLILIRLKVLLRKS